MIISFYFTDTNRVDGTRISSEMEKALIELSGFREGLEVTIDTNASSILRRRKEVIALL